MCPGFASSSPARRLPLSIRQSVGCFSNSCTSIALPFLGVEAATCLFQFPHVCNMGHVLQLQVLEIGGKKIILPFPARTSPRASLVAQVHKNPPAHGRQFLSLVWEVPTCCEATKPVLHRSEATDYSSLPVPEATLPNRENEKPVGHSRESCPCSLQLGEKPAVKT